MKIPCCKTLRAWALLALGVLVLGVLVLGVGGLAGLSAHAETKKLAGPPVPHSTLKTEDVVIVTAKGDRHVFDAEIARTPSEQAYGLMNRTSMAPDHGMLFVFNDEIERSFWMKNTLIPLDMIFIRGDGVIHRIHPSAIPHDLTPVFSQGPARAVLELNGGRAADLGIKAGDRVIHKTFGKR